MVVTRKYYEDTSSPYFVVASGEDYFVDFIVYKGEDEGESLFEGSIKWDGCSNWDFPNGHYPLHFCSKIEALNFYGLFSELYNLAAEMMPKHKDCLGEDKYEPPSSL